MPQQKMNKEKSVTVHQATLAEIEVIVPLFDAYRQFYGKPSNFQESHAFLLERFKHNQSILFLANDSTGAVIGFVQLYPSFSSVSAARIFILNDLFVVPSVRRRGVASLLLKAAADYGRAAGAIRLTLSTGVSNKNAQALYERDGWNRDSEFYVYHLPLKA
jgi:GNAT superfamily N-acetyltransferase